jgi:hypothetical protein
LNLWPVLLRSIRPSISVPASAQFVPRLGFDWSRVPAASGGKYTYDSRPTFPVAVPFVVSMIGVLTGPPPQVGSRTPADGIGGVQVTLIAPANPFTEVKVNEIKPAPVAGIVMLLAEIVKLAVGAGILA